MSNTVLSMDAPDNFRTAHCLEPDADSQIAALLHPRPPLPSGRQGCHPFLYRCAYMFRMAVRKLL